MDLAQPLREKYEAQIDKIVAVLNDKGRTYSRESEQFKTALEWVKNFPVDIGESRRALLVDTICAAFSITESDLYRHLGDSIGSPYLIPAAARPVVEEFEALVPKEGWFRQYVEYTRRTEAPMSFHVFSSLCVLGAALGRRAWFDMGSLFRIYPNYRIILIGPTGKVHKTAAVSVARRLIHSNALLPIFADKITPEALVSAMKESGGSQLIYAPEASVFLGRQKYNEGLITLLLRLLDDPDSFEVRTEVRATETVENVALSFMGCSTLSLLSGSSASNVLSGGFLNRFVLVVEEDTSRIFPEPWIDTRRLPEMERTISRIRTTTGNFSFTDAARIWWVAWYTDFKGRIREYDETTAEAMQRFPDHMIRTAMLSHIADCGNMLVCVGCLERADKWISYIQRRIPGMVQVIEQTQTSSDTEFVANALLKMGGAAQHSKLLQRCSYRMNAAVFKSNITTLVESKRVVVERKGAMHFYALMKETK